MSFVDSIERTQQDLRKRWNSDESSLLSSNIQLTSSSSSSLSPPFEVQLNEIKQQQIMANNTSGVKSAVAQKTTCHLTNSFLEISIRLLLFTIFIQLERTPAFKRKIHPEELWLYKNPPTRDYVPASILMPASFFVPFLIICLNFLLTQDKYDFMKGTNVISLSIPLNGVLTSLLKITIGRPRPDFFYRCFPDGIMRDDMNCTGEARIVNEGRKSFPSGHSSFAFAGFGFIFLYLAAKLHCFNDKGRGQSWRLCTSLIPLFVALLVAISRTCDYHHHWEDVVVGSIIGMAITCLCYRQYYPPIYSLNCHRPYGKCTTISGKCYVSVTSDNLNNHHLQNDETPLLEEEKDTKWI